MMQHDPVEQAASGVQDPDAFREACDIFGNDGALTRLRAFREDLGQLLSWIGQGSPERAKLQEMAHKTVGRAGFLGFPALVRASVRLDEAARWNNGVADALDRWTAEARLAATETTDWALREAPDAKGHPPTG